MALPAASGQTVGTTAIDGGYNYVVASVMGQNVWQRTSAAATPGGDLVEQLTVTATNTIADFTSTQLGTAKLFVNGEAFSETDPSPAFTITGQSVTWNAANAGFNVDTTDELFIDLG